MKNSLNKKVENLSNTIDKICVSIALPTYRTFPENKQDSILLKNLIGETEKNLINRFGKRETVEIIKRIQSTLNIDMSYNLDSLHVFVSNNTTEVVRLPISIKSSEVIVNDSFDTHYLTETIENSKEYLILVLSQSGVQLYDALNENIVSEIENNNFPFDKNELYLSNPDKSSDAKRVDNLVREYFNRVDKAVQEVHKATNLEVVVVSTPRNYQHLIHVSDNEKVYLGNSPINYNDVALHTLGKQAMQLVK